MSPAAVSATALNEERARGATPAPEYVMSRYADGRVASRYCELKWDWTPYSPNGRPLALNFMFWGHAEAPRPTHKLLLSEMQFIMFLLIRKRLGATLSADTLNNYADLLRHLARYCERRALCIRDVLTDKDHVLSYAIGQTKSRLEYIASLLSNLDDFGAEELGYQVLGEQVKRTLRELVRQYFIPARQHPPIPTRIYSRIIANLMQEFTEFESVAEEYISLAHQSVRDPWLGRSVYLSAQRMKRRDLAATGPCIGREIRVPELLARHGLTDYFHAKALNPSTQGLSKGLGRIQTIARLTVHVFTGMRVEEASSLKYSCLEVTLRQGKEHFVLLGSTTKLNYGRAKAVRWVTNREAARAIKIARRIADLIHGAYTKHKDLTEPTPSSAPLFVAISHLGFVGQGAATRRIGRLLPGRFCQTRNFPGLSMLLQPAIDEADLRGLEQIDPHRAWRSEERFKIGTPWTLTTHQLRRSLALYAQRSGLVSLPSLRRQLQHVTEEMSQYHARGSTCAKNLIGDYKHHFGREWQEAQPVSAAMSYLCNVLLTDEVLFGAHGNWLEKRVRGPDATIVLDREATLRRFEKGDLAYRETSLGGCASTETCDKLPIGWLNIECVNGCKNFVGRLPKLDHAILAQTKLINGLDPGSAEFRIEMDDLAVLTKARDKVRQRTPEIA